MKPRRLLIRPLAQLDFAEAALWYQQQRIGLGDEFLDAVRQKIEQIKERPESFPIVRRKETRRALVDRFPYGVFFIVTEQIISVIAVFHTSRDLKRHLRNR